MVAALLIGVKANAPRVVTSNIRGAAMQETGSCTMLAGADWRGDDINSLAKDPGCSAQWSLSAFSPTQVQAALDVLPVVPASYVLLLMMLLAALAPILPADADTIPQCPLAQGVEDRSLQLPVAIRDDLTKRVGSIAPPGAAFDNTDAVAAGVSRRLIYVRTKGRRWVIATEHGSAAYNDPVFAYDMSSDGSLATFVKEEVALPPTVCKIANQLLGVSSQ